MKRFGLAMLLVFSAFSCFAAPRPRSDEAEIRAALDSTSAGWNRGDLKTYLAYYTPNAQEMGPNGPRGGVEGIENTMKNRFRKTGRPLQQLHFEHVAVRMLGKANAMVTGQFVLTSGGKPDRTGWFTTVWEKTREGWRMIFDHSKEPKSSVGLYPNATTSYLWPHHAYVRQLRRHPNLRVRF